MSVLLETSLGPLVVDLFVQQCPQLSRNFVALSKLRYYDGCLVFSVQQDFVCQTGDATGTGRGGVSAAGLVRQLQRQPQAPPCLVPDELHADQFITDATWAALKAHFTDKQCMDVVFTCGQYTQVSMILNSFGVQLDAGQTLDPDLKAF